MRLTEASATRGMTRLASSAIRCSIASIDVVSKRSSPSWANAARASSGGWRSACWSVLIGAGPVWSADGEGVSTAELRTFGRPKAALPGSCLDRRSLTRGRGSRPPGVSLTVRVLRSGWAWAGWGGSAAAPGPGGHPGWRRRRAPGRRGGHSRPRTAGAPGPRLQHGLDDAARPGLHITLPVTRVRRPGRPARTAPAAGPAPRRRCGLEGQLGGHVVDVQFNCAGGDAEGLRDLLVRVAGDQPAEHLQVAAAETVQVPGRGHEHALFGAVHPAAPDARPGRNSPPRSARPT